LTCGFFILLRVISDNLWQSVANFVVRHLVPDHASARGSAVGRQVFPVYWLRLGMRLALLPHALATVEVGHLWRHRFTFGALSA
jgi:hypothetical protein